jgi:hypothetical protein
MSRRGTSILIIAAIFLLGSGAIARIHDAAHALHDSTAADDHEDHRHHDETNCDLHAQLLNTPVAPAGSVPLLVLLGLFVAFLTQLPQSIERRHVAQRIDCRGPPVC